ncbi:MAG TPA: c-type cytochrome [Candidatus Acidoferrales bacterium]|nr:c-type cytochrome [Candidatus Acidoferrales bacterium]
MKGRKAWLWIVLVLAVIILLAGFAASRASISALDEPGRFETALAIAAKREVVARAAAKMHFVEPAYSDASAKTGHVLFSIECATCHGDGRVPSRIGQSMYPRVPDLGSAEIQKWSDAELFWIIQHGVRLSGMPGFKKMDTDEQVWHLVHYIRTLPNRSAQ